MLTFCSTSVVPKGDACSEDIDKARRNTKALEAEALVFSPSAELCYSRLEEATGSFPLGE